MSNFELQPILKNNLVLLRPLKEDFEHLYLVASDPLIWEQHPNSDRYQRDVFEIFFKEALQSGGAFLILEAHSLRVIGSSRYYNLDTKNRSITIGYTFLARWCWGKGYNFAVKSLMLNHAFRFVDQVLFFVGVNNIRSQIALKRLGAVQAETRDGKYCYKLSASVWGRINNNFWNAAP